VRASRTIPPDAKVAVVHHRVPFYETDAMGIVHHSNYVRYLEIGRIRWLDEHDRPYRDWVAAGYHYATTRVEVEYLRSAVYDDVLEIRTWLEEVRGLQAAGVLATAKPFQFIGYGELRAHLEGVVPLSVAVKAIQQATRRYAKRQITWFRREADVQWFSGFGDHPEIAAAVLEYLSRQLGARNPSRASSAAGV